MNTVTEQHLNATLEQLPISTIRPSPFKAQTLRRSHFSTEKMIELAASIKANGVLQPILVRPINGQAGTQYEIVAGERRWIAADRAGLGHIPATVRDMTDHQVLEAQLVENLQREGLQALEEAEGYAELMTLSAINADAVADKIGKSRSYVYARLKLLDLIPEAREALQDGELDASKALIIARIRGEKMQARALNAVLTRGDSMSYRRLMDHLREETMISLAQAPWLPDRDTLHLPKGGEPCQQCATCPSRSLNDPELAAEIGDRDLCLDSDCHTLKTKLHYARVRREAEAEGRTILSGDDAKGLPVKHYETAANGYVRLDADCDAIEFEDKEPHPEYKEGESEEAYEARAQAWQDRCDAWQQPTYAQALGDIPGTVLVEHAGKLIPMAPADAVAKALKAKKLDVPWQVKSELQRGRSNDDDNDDDNEQPARDPAKEAAERAREEERHKVELEFRARLLKQIHAKFKGPLKLQDLQRIAETITEHYEFSEALEALYPDAATGSLNIQKLKEPDLLRLLVLRVIDGDCQAWHTNAKPTDLLEYAQRLKIDAKKLRAEVVKDLKPVSAAASPEEKPEPKKKATAKKGAKK
jgi:ParB/RepB/Spo0J family partition protein